VIDSTPSASSAPCGAFHSGTNLGSYAPVATIGSRRCQHAGPGNDSLIDRIPQSNVGVTSAFGAEIANRREAGHQRRTQVVHRTRRAQRQRLVCDLKLPLRFVVRVQQNVRVAFDEPRRQREAREIDDARVAGVDARCRSRRVDAIADDPHRPPLVHRCAVEHACRTQHDRCCICCLSVHANATGRGNNQHSQTGEPTR
jgi:hypothetical protein